MVNKQYPNQKKFKENRMAAKKKTQKTFPYLEQWNTRYGLSERVVLRKGGRFVDNISLTALKRGTRVGTR